MRRALAAVVIAGGSVFSLTGCSEPDNKHYAENGNETDYPAAEHTRPAASDTEPTVLWEEPQIVDSGDARRGPWQMNASRWHFVDDPTVAINDEGVTAVAWANHETQDVYLQLFEPGGSRRFDDPVNISQSPGVFSWLPRLVIGGNNADKIHMLWQEIVFSGGSHGGEIYYAKSSDGGHTFGEPVNLSQTTAGAGKGRISEQYWHNGSLDMVIGDDGTIYTAWTEYEGRLWFRRSGDGGQSFEKPVQIAGGDSELPARGPSLALSDEDVLYLAWTVGEDPHADIRVSRSADRGDTFEHPVIIPGEGAHADGPKLVIDSGGNVHLVYAEGKEGPFGAYEIRYTWKRTGVDEFTEPQTIESLPDGENFEGSHFPHLHADAAGHLYLIWELFPVAGEYPAGLGFALSENNGQSFSAPELIPGSYDPELGHSGSQQGLLMNKMAVNAHGEIAVVNSTFRRNEVSHIWLFRGQADGS